VTFEVKNTATEAPIAIDLVATVTSTVNGVASTWPLSLSHTQVTLGAADPAVTVTAEFQEPAAAVFGLDLATVDIEAVANTPGGAVSLGGVRIIDYADPDNPEPIPTLSEWGMILVGLLLLVVSAFVFRPGRSTA
jgi:hypothetical protein